MRRLYLDHNATTPLVSPALDRFNRVAGEVWGNASSVHHFGQQAKAVLDGARASVAALLGAEPSELVFTGGGTDGDNAAVRGAAEALEPSGRRHLVVSSIEHEAVLQTAKALARRGWRVTFLPVGQTGVVEPAALADALGDDTALVSVMHANNEIGTLQPVADIARLVRGHGALMHTDAVQGGGSLDINVDRLGVDLLTLAAHKFHGPKGVGILYARQGTPLLPEITGGSQERNRRAGTENIAGIVGTATALTWAQVNRVAHAAHLARLRDRLIAGILGAVPDTALTGHPTERLPGLASFAIAGLSGAEELLLGLDQAGICASSGSACTSASLEPSYVLRACGLPSALAVGSLRLSLGYANTDADVDHALATLPPLVERLRELARLMQG